MLKTNDLQDTMYTYMDDDINVTINNSYLFVPYLIPSVETQLMFNEATQNNYEISFDEWYTERQVISDMIVQRDVEQQVNSPKCLICAHQTKDMTNATDKKITLLFSIISIFENIMLK